MFDSLGSMDWSSPGSFTHGISQARTLERGAISSSSRSSWPRDRTHVSCTSYIGRWILYQWATWEENYYYHRLNSFNRENLFLIVLEPGKSKDQYDNKVSLILRPNFFFLSCRWLPICYVLKRPLCVLGNREISLSSFSYKTTNFIDYDSILMT